ncbi:MAG TPA: hypothetical protein VLC74_12010 [Rhizomicrobium sp.]|nr:hypothetical protein [Rhizomicrobium sp.]
MFKKLRTQMEVLSALAIREMQGKMKASRYGYVWLFIEPLFYVLIFRIAIKRGLGQTGSIEGMTPLMYGVLGIIPLYCCFTAIQTYPTIVKPSKLLGFSRVTVIDLAIANGATAFAIYFFLFWAVSLPISIYENAWPPRNIVQINLALIAGWLLGMSTAFALSGLYRVFPGIKGFTGYVIWGLRMISGYVFCAAQVPMQYWPYLTWNPLLHVTELTRSGWFESYVSPIANPSFIAECILGMTLLGLSVERFMRRVREA